LINSRLEYNKRIEKYKTSSDRLVHQLNWISNFRLLTAIIGFGIPIYLLYRNEGLLSAGIFIPALALFIWLVIRHDRLKQKKARVDALWKINRDSVKRLDGEWTAFEDIGAEFQDPEHQFSGDLDLFGRNSLYQWINSAVTYRGRKTLKDLLICPSKQKGEILERQRAVKELSSFLDWRQQLQSEALLSVGRFQDPQPLFQWAQQTDAFYSKTYVRYLIWILPLLTILLFAGAFVLPGVPFFVPVLFLMAQIGLLGYRFTDRNQKISSISSFVSNVKAYRAMLEIVEKQEFRTEYLTKLQYKLRNGDGKTAADQIRKLEKVMELVSVRSSQLYLVINILFLWDYRCAAALESWRAKSGPVIKEWIDVLGEMEALSSLAILNYDHPGWAVPDIYCDQPRLFGTEIGHPLLPENRVSNDISMMKRGQVYLITGSNMSGKSTLLRTIGINLVLAYAGAPVCAREFHCAVFNIYTSMRVRDDLESSTSSFYAELLRIKRMIDAAKSGEPVFFLLDEIFKGTNSRDRHTGARVLIKQLSAEGAIGFVSTHDVELGNLANEDSKIRNFHFREYYKEGQLYFDYKLHQGISNTRNAIYLMKIMGITVPDKWDNEDGD
jgi:ABC-type multidrug transport system fused ATPase/permease subunit